MFKRQLILISPDIEAKGKEFGDLSSSLSGCYERALLEAGALPLTLPATISRDALAECVHRSDGVLLTGGDDVDPRLYAERLPARARRTVGITPDGGARDFRELLLLDEVFRQRKPLLAICRGHQLLNVALGGALVADISTQMPGALNHRRLDKRNETVHEVYLTPGSLLAKITGKAKLAVNSTHHQAVGRVAEPLQAVAVSRDGIVEGLELKAGAVGCLPFLLSVQFHPERLTGRYAEHRAIFTRFTRACARNRKNNL
jgi:putative glutamine amidotransferase